LEGEWPEQIVAAIAEGYPQDVPDLLPTGLINEGLLDDALYEAGRGGYGRLITYLFQRGAANPTNAILGLIDSEREHPLLLENLLNRPIPIEDAKEILTQALRNNAGNITREISIRFPTIIPSHTYFNTASLWWILYYKEVEKVYGTAFHFQEISLLTGGFGFFYSRETVGVEHLFGIGISSAPLPFPFSWEEWADLGGPISAVLTEHARRLLIGESDDWDKIRHLWRIYNQLEVFDLDEQWSITMGKLAWREEVEFLYSVADVLETRGESGLHLILSQHLPEEEIEELASFASFHDIATFDPRVNLFTRRRYPMMFYKAGEWTPKWLSLLNSYRELGRNPMIEAVKYAISVGNETLLDKLWGDANREIKIDMLGEMLADKSISEYNSFVVNIVDLTDVEIAFLRDNAIRGGLNVLVTKLGAHIPDIFPMQLAEHYPRLANDLGQRVHVANISPRDQIENEIREADSLYTELLPHFERVLTTLETPE
jgi:hypothetical protein